MKAGELQKQRKIYSDREMGDTMQDSSSEISPGRPPAAEPPGFWPLGRLVSFRKEARGRIDMVCEHGFLSAAFCGNRTVRITVDSRPAPPEGSFAVRSHPDYMEATLSEEEKQLRLAAGGLVLTVDKETAAVTVFDQEGKLLLADVPGGTGFSGRTEAHCRKQLDDADRFYGFGEKTGFLDKRGDRLVMWNSDVFAPHNPETDPLYQSIPFFLTLRNGNAHGLFLDSTAKTVFDMKGQSGHYTFSSDSGGLDYYIFAGPSLKDVIGQYTELTGRMPLPPKWALGYHQSRYSYESEQEVRELAARFKEQEIPLDAIYSDIHYMDDYRVFTFDQERFPDPAGLIRDLKSEGIRLIPIVDPGVKKDPEYRVYKEGVADDHFCRFLEGDVFFGDVWPGTSAFPDFTEAQTRHWWGENHAFYTEMGVEGIWNDMNEPSVFNETKTMDLGVVHRNGGNPKTHRELHNAYGLLMSEATYEGLKRQLAGRRPFVLTRAGYAGIQRWAAVWTGDNRSFWEHLQMALPMCMNLGMSGVAFSGPDVGGFAHHASGELLARWTQAGAFMPYFRNHSVLGSDRQEPWSFGEKYGEVIRNSIQARYVWLPYLYGLFREASTTGIPVMRPLVLEYPDDPAVSNLADQFLAGPDVLVAPVLVPGQEKRMVYLPEGEWVDYWEDTILEGGKHIIADAPLDRLPLFIKNGAIIVHGPVRRNAEAEIGELAVHLYIKEQAAGSALLYDDDGISLTYREGCYFEERMEAEVSAGKVEIRTAVLTDGWHPAWRNRRKFVLHNIKKGTEITVDDERVPEKRITYHDGRQKAEFRWTGFGGEADGETGK
ncbi:TIM-barrel domain-containing protein [Indiicoccus explosivorum]|uniref:glycoside hydrolase family 31 protein n=1 Tax=Indiicoccus explosivorum TaxID=1917864 RepID=UPI001F4EA6E6|nr:TIM-barrel domain-containing protein [Indiicoccus explosivorum]